MAVAPDALTVAATVYVPSAVPAGTVTVSGTVPSAGLPPECNVSTVDDGFPVHAVGASVLTLTRASPGAVASTSSVNFTVAGALADGITTLCGGDRAADNDRVLSVAGASPSSSISDSEVVDSPVFAVTLSR